MFQAEMLSNGGRPILVLVNAPMQMPPCVTNITCITQVTLKFIIRDCWFTMGGLTLSGFRCCLILWLSNMDWTVTWIFWLRSWSCALTISSLLGLTMTEVQLKRRAFFLIIFTSICFKKYIGIQKI